MILPELAFSKTLTNSLKLSLDLLLIVVWLLMLPKASYLLLFVLA